MAMAQERNSEATQVNRFLNFGMRLGVSVALHPFEYSKILIQVRVSHYMLHNSYLGFVLEPRTASIWLLLLF